MSATWRFSAIDATGVLPAILSTALVPWCVLGNFSLCRFRLAGLLPATPLAVAAITAAFAGMTSVSWPWSGTPRSLVMPMALFSTVFLISGALCLPRLISRAQDLRPTALSRAASLTVTGLTVSSAGFVLALACNIFTWLAARNGLVVRFLVRFLLFAAVAELAAVVQRAAVRRWVLPHVSASYSVAFLAPLSFGAAFVGRFMALNVSSFPECIAMGTLVTLTSVVARASARQRDAWVGWALCGRSRQAGAGLQPGLMALTQPQQAAHDRAFYAGLAVVGEASELLGILANAAAIPLLRMPPSTGAEILSIPDVMARAGVHLAIEAGVMVLPALLLWASPLLFVWAADAHVNGVYQQSLLPKPRPADLAGHSSTGAPSPQQSTSPPRFVTELPVLAELAHGDSSSSLSMQGWSGGMRRPSADEVEQAAVGSTMHSMPARASPALLLEATAPVALRSATPPDEQVTSERVPPTLIVAKGRREEGVDYDQQCGPTLSGDSLCSAGRCSPVPLAVGQEGGRIPSDGPASCGSFMCVHLPIGGGWAGPTSPKPHAHIVPTIRLDNLPASGGSQVEGALPAPRAAVGPGPLVHTRGGGVWDASRDVSEDGSVGPPVRMAEARGISGVTASPLGVQISYTRSASTGLHRPTSGGTPQYGSARSAGPVRLGHLTPSMASGSNFSLSTLERGGNSALCSGPACCEAPSKTPHPCHGSACGQFCRRAMSLTWGCCAMSEDDTPLLRSHAEAVQALMLHSTTVHQAVWQPMHTSRWLELQAAAPQLVGGSVGGTSTHPPGHCSSSTSVPTFIDDAPSSSRPAQRRSVRPRQFPLSRHALLLLEVWLARTTAAWQTLPRVLFLGLLVLVPCITSFAAFQVVHPCRKCPFLPPAQIGQPDAAYVYDSCSWKKLGQRQLLSLMRPIPLLAAKHGQRPADTHTPPRKTYLHLLPFHITLAQPGPGVAHFSRLDQPALAPEAGW
ncbi:unnamed protein product [Symbiodinium sp. KB8]|nr:unnamed protein product [Symbiodinium sp. KB8]